MRKNTKKGYSVVIALLMVGFLLILTVGILNLVLRELYSNRGSFDYLKAYAGAEASQELALLSIKNNGYAYRDKVENNINNKSIILGNNPLNQADFKAKKEVLISYDLNYTVNSYSGNLDKLSYDIIPLFFITDLGEKKVNDVTLTINSGNSDDLVWNIIGKSSGISGKGSFTTTAKGYKKSLLGSVLSFDKVETGDFLKTSSGNYLVLFNSSGANPIEYSLKSDNPIEFFTKPKTEIISSGVVGKYRQNLRTTLDNTEFLNILKYAIYSGK